MHTFPVVFVVGIFVWCRFGNKSETQRLSGKTSNTIRMYCSCPVFLHPKTHFCLLLSLFIVEIMPSYPPPLFCVFIHILTVAPVVHLEGCHKQGTWYNESRMAHWFWAGFRLSANPTFQTENTKPHLNNTAGARKYCSIAHIQHTHQTTGSIFGTIILGGGVVFFLFKSNSLPGMNQSECL